MFTYSATDYIFCLDLHFYLYSSSLRLGPVPTVVCWLVVVYIYGTVSSKGWRLLLLLRCFLSPSSSYTARGFPLWYCTLRIRRLKALSLGLKGAWAQRGTNPGLVQQSSCVCVYLSGMEYIMAWTQHTLINKERRSSAWDNLFVKQYLYLSPTDNIM